MRSVGCPGAEFGVSTPARAVAWLAFLTAGGLADWLLDRRHDGSTLSEVTRFVFRVDRPEGRAAFLLTWGGFAVWFAKHICKYPVTRKDLS